MRSWETRSTYCHGPTHTGAVPNLSPSLVATAGETGKDGEKGGKGHLEPKADSEGIHHVDAVHRFQLAAPVRALHIEVAVERVADGLRVHGGAVVELDVGPELDGHGLAAVAHRGEVGRELGEDAQVFVDLVELLAHLLEDDAAHVGPREGGIEKVRVLVERNHQRLLLGQSRLRGEDEPEAQG